MLHATPKAQPGGMMPGFASCANHGFASPLGTSLPEPSPSNSMSGTVTMAQRK